jgi:preprotein translocase SecE subunit
MANEPASNDSKSDDASKRKRRVLRPAAEASSFREMSEQAQAKSGKPRRFSRAGNAASTPFRFIGRLVKPLGKIKFFRAIGYILFPPYFRNSIKELRLVTWPDRMQTRRLTFAVIVFSLLFGTIVAGVDYGLDKAFRALILKN